MSEGALTTFFSAFVTLLVTAITAGATLSASARPIPGWLKIVGGGATVGMIIFGTQLIQVSIADPPILPSMSIPVPSISPTTPGEVQGVTTATIVAIPSLEPTNSDSNIGNITTIVPNTETLRVGNFEFNYGSGLSNHATGTYGRGQPQQGRWLIVLLYVKNVGSEPAKIPDNFFAVKDMQGRISYFDRAASTDYINRFGGIGPGGAGDFDINNEIPLLDRLGSVPLLFDTYEDAHIFTLFSPYNPNHSYQVREP